MANCKSQEVLNILVDKNSQGKERPWRKKKISNLLTSKLYKSISAYDGDYWSKKADRLSKCSTFLVFNVEPDQLKLKSMNSCCVRLCPMCAWRRTLKIGSHAKKIFNYLLNQYGTDKYSFLSLTLTAPNCTSNDLSNSITHFMQSFDRLFKRTEVKRVVRGWYRGLEVTHNHNINSKSYDTYHPHFHILLVVDSSYLSNKTVERGYISHERWLDLWREAYRDNSITQVCIKTIKPKRKDVSSPDALNSTGLFSAICEFAKYTVKDKDYVLPYDWDLSKDIVKTLDDALANRRLVAWGGILKDIHKMLNLDDEVNGDLVHIDDDALESGYSDDLLFAFWHTGYQQYVVK